MQETKVQFQDYTVEEKRGRKKMVYNAVLTTTGFENKQIQVRVRIDLDAYIALDPKYATARTERQEQQLESTADYISSGFRRALQETKALRYTKKGDTLLIYHSGNIGYPYKIENVSQKTVVILEQESNRLVPSLVVLGVDLFCIYVVLFIIYTIFIAKKESNNNNSITQ
jgi:hypothetical protein